MWSRGFGSTGDDICLAVVTDGSDNQPAGEYAVEWNARELPSGVYFYRLRAGAFHETRKMVLGK